MVCFNKTISSKLGSTSQYSQAMLSHTKNFLPKNERCRGKNECRGWPGGFSKSAECVGIHTIQYVLNSSTWNKKASNLMLFQKFLNSSANVTMIKSSPKVSASKVLLVFKTPLTLNSPSRLQIFFHTVCLC